MAVFDFMWHTFQRSPRHIAKQQAAAAATAAGKTSASGSLGFAWCSVIGSLHYLVTFDVDAKYFSIDGNLCGFFEVCFQVHSQLQMHLHYYKEFIIIRYCGKTL